MDIFDLKRDGTEKPDPQMVAALQAQIDEANKAKLQRIEDELVKAVGELRETRGEIL